MHLSLPERATGEVRDLCSCLGWRRTSETDRVCSCVPVEGEFKLEVDVVIVRFNAEELDPARWEPCPPLPEILSCIVGKVGSEEGGKESMLRVKETSVPRESEREEVERHPRLHSAEEDDRLLKQKSASGVLFREDGAGSSSHEVAWPRVRRARGAREEWRGSDRPAATRQVEMQNPAVVTAGSYCPKSSALVW